MAAGQGYDAGAIVARLIIDKGQWTEAVQAVKRDQEDLAAAVAKGNVPLSQFGDLLKKYGVQTAQDVRASIATLRGDQVLLDTAFRDGVITLGGYQKASAEVSKQLKDLDGTTNAAANGHKNLIGQIALGQAAYNILAAAARGAWSVLRESIQGAIEEEKAERNLTAALEMSGRTIEGNKQHYLDFAMAQHRATLYTHEQVEAAQALLIQYLKLDQEGMDKATKGAIGLAAVMGTDLQSAAVLVTRAINNDTESIGRMKLHIDESLPPQEKQAAILNEIVKLYGRATAETETFGGRTIQLTKTIDEIKESIGKLVIVGIEPFVRLIGKAAQVILDLIEAENHLSKVTETAGDISAAYATRLMFAAEKAGMTADEYGKLTSQCKVYTDSVEDQIQGYKNLGLSSDQINERLNLTHAEYTINAAKLMELIKKTEFGAEAFKILAGTARDTVPQIKEVGDAAGAASPEITKFIRSMTTEISASTKTQYEAARDAANMEYLDRLDAIKKMTATDKEYAAARGAAATALAAKLKEINRGEADDEAQLGMEIGAAVTKYNDEIKKKLAEREKLEGDFYNEISAAEKKCVEEQIKGYDTRLAADAKLHDEMAALGKSGLALELANLKKDEDAAIAELKRKEAQTGTSYAKEIPLAKHYYAELARLAKQDQSAKILIAGWEAVNQMVSAALAAMAQNYTNTYNAMQKRSDAYFKSQQDKLDAESAKKLSDLEIWYEAQKKAIEDSTMDEAGKKAAMEALDKEYAEKKEKAEKEAADKQAKLDAAKASKDLEIKRQAFDAQKRINLANAIMSTAAAIISAAQMVPFIPFGIIAMAAAAVAGAIQIATIKSTQMPLAKGAAFTQPTEFYTSGGGHYVAGEEGMELMVGEKVMRQVLRSELGGEKNRGAKPIYHLHFDIGGKEVQKFILDTGQTLGFDANGWKVNRRNNG